LTSFELNAAGEYVSPITRLEREIDELKKDKAAKDAMIKELQERLNKLEAAQNLLN
jgi:prefoldin subunit 5